MSQPAKTGTLTLNTIAYRHEIRSTGLSKLNRISRAAPHLADLREAFDAWNAGDIFICKKTGDYRYRYGDLSKSRAPWSTLARHLFATPAEFAFAALIFTGGTASGPPEQERPSPPSTGRVNVLEIAAERRAA